MSEHTVQAELRGMHMSQEQDTALFDQPDGVDIWSPVHEAKEPQFGASSDTTLVLTCRVRASIRVVSSKFVEVKLQIKLTPEHAWMNLHDEDSPFLVARRGDTTPESMSLYGLSLLKSVLEAGGAVVQFGAHELRPGHGTNEFRWWAHLGSRLSVAVQVDSSGVVRVVGLR